MKRKISILVKPNSVIYPKTAMKRCERSNDLASRILLLLTLLTSALHAEDRQIDPTWLHRYLPQVNSAHVDFSSAPCVYKAIFGEGDAESRAMISVARFGEATVNEHGACESVQYERQENLYFVLEGKGIVHYADRTYPLRPNDFIYVAPGVKHSIENNSDRTLRVVIMGFKIPSTTSISVANAEPRIVNMEDLKEQTVEGHPTSVQYKLLAGPRTGKRDAIDQAYVVVSLFWMNFAPGGTNFPHHHEAAEEIYLVVDGEGEVVAGGGMDGIEGRHPAKAGDAYYFRPNCTVGFYNQNKAGAKAHILAVRSRVPRPKDQD